MLHLRRNTQNVLKLLRNTGRKIYTVEAFENLIVGKGAEKKKSL